MLSIALDTTVLDHLYRIEAGTYKGSSASSLGRLFSAATEGRILVWVSEIADVEMLHGIEPITDLSKAEVIAAKDVAKRCIGRKMKASVLGYPCARLGDTYSRLGVSFHLACADSKMAGAFEQRVLDLAGVSPGDARQLVSCAFPFDGEKPEQKPRIDWFVAEDRRLIAAMNDELNRQLLPELASVRFGTADDLMRFHPTIQ